MRSDGLNALRSSYHAASPAAGLRAAGDDGPATARLQPRQQNFLQRLFARARRALGGGRAPTRPQASAPIGRSVEVCYHQWRQANRPARGKEAINLGKAANACLAVAPGDRTLKQAREADQAKDVLDELRAVRVAAKRAPRFVPWCLLAPFAVCFRPFMPSVRQRRTHRGHVEEVAQRWGIDNRNLSSKPRRG